VRDDETAAPDLDRRRRCRSARTRLLRGAPRPGLLASSSRTVSGIAQELTVFVAADDPVKLSRLTLRNTGAAPAAHGDRATSSGPSASLRQGARCTSHRPSTRRAGLLRAQHLPQRHGIAVAFADTSAAASAPTRATVRRCSAPTATSQRPGRAGSLRLSDRVGAGYDPCAALQVEVSSAPARRTIVWWSVRCEAARTPASSSLRLPRAWASRAPSLRP
jgi:cyclic beta-1,2-glucan synthetase